MRLKALYNNQYIFFDTLIFGKRQLRIYNAFIRSVLSSMLALIIFLGSMILSDYVESGVLFAFSLVLGGYIFHLVGRVVIARMSGYS